MRKFALVVIDTHDYEVRVPSLVGNRFKWALSTEAAMFRRYEINENGKREQTHDGIVASMAAVFDGDLRAAITLLLKQWKPYAGPATQPTRPSGTPVAAEAIAA